MTDTSVETAPAAPAAPKYSDPVSAPSNIVVFQPNEVAEFGNKLLRSIILTDRAVEEAESVLNTASKNEVFVDVEMTKAALFLHEEGRVDLFKIYGNKADSGTLYRAILTEMGVLNRTVTDDDKVVYEFTDPLLRDEYNYNEELKKTDENEYNRRHSRRNALNIRLARISKAAVALFESGTKPDDMIYRNDENGNIVAVITKGPAKVQGEESEIVLKPGVGGKAGKAKGAEFTSSLNGLAKLADSEHRDDTPSKGKAESTTLKSGETSTTTSEENFLATGNTMIMLINNREGEFSDAEKTLLKNLLTSIKEYGIR